MISKGEVIWRDDDVNWLTSLEQFSKVHELFNKYEVLHTVALIAKDIKKNPKLIKYINAQVNIDVQLHCWTHMSFPENTADLAEELTMGADMIEELFGRRPKTVYPPWNKTNNVVNGIAASVDLWVSTEKTGVSAYAQNGGEVSVDVVNFHYWNDGDTMFLDQALSIYVNRHSRCQ